MENISLTHSFLILKQREILCGFSFDADIYTWQRGDAKQ